VEIGADTRWADHREHGLADAVASSAVKCTVATLPVDLEEGVNIGDRSSNVPGGKVLSMS